MVMRDKVGSGSVQTKVTGLSLRDGLTMSTDGFVDRFKRYSFLLNCEIAQLLLKDPALVEAARDHLEKFTRVDPRQKPSYKLWKLLLDGPLDVIVERLTEVSERGDYVRETAPCFTVVPLEVRTRLMAQAKRPLQNRSLTFPTR